jgi:hypothetical protein
MIRYGNPQEVEEYFADGSVSQSYLKTLIAGVDFLTEDEKTRYYEEKGHFVIGSAVDVWLTQGKENYDAQFFSFEGKKPSDSIMSIVKQVFDSACFDDNPPEGDLHQYPEYVLEAADAHNYSSNWKAETRVNKIMESGFEYFEQLKLAYGKQILGDIETSLVQNIVMSLQTGTFTSQYFTDARHIDIYHQVPIYFESEGVPCKALLDKVIVDRITKEIRPVDIKTIGDSPSKFPQAAFKRGYNIQGAFYTEALIQLRNNLAQSPIDMELTEEYTVKPFLFLVETTVYKTNAVTGETKYNTGKPLVYGLGLRQFELGRDGRPQLISKFEDGEIIYPEIVGYKGALKLYKWHLENGFEYDKKVFNNFGVIPLE